MNAADVRYAEQFPDRVAGKDQPEKNLAALALNGPDLECSVCWWPLTLGASSAFAHEDHDGGKIRGEGNNRPEIRRIAKDGVKVAGRSYMCSNCNNEHNTWITREALEASPRVQKLRKQREILKAMGEW